MDVVGRQLAGRIATEQAVEDLEDGVVEFVLEDADQVALDGRAGRADAVHFEDDAVLLAQQRVGARQRQAADADLVAQTFAFAERSAASVQTVVFVDGHDFQ